MATGGGAINTPPSGPQPSQIQTKPPFVAFKPDSVPPSQFVYLQLNDNIFLNIASNSNTQLTLRVTYRYLTPQGEIKEGTRLVLYSQLASDFFNLGEGWLLSFGAQVTTNPATGTWTFLQVAIGRSLSPGQLTITYAMIWQGFVLRNAPNGWPGTPSKEITDGQGIIRSITGNTPAAGQEINEVVPLNTRWLLLSLRATLTNSATVANRNATLAIDDGANGLYQSNSFINSTASQTLSYCTQILNFSAGSFSGPVSFLIPPSFPLKSGFRIRTQTAGLQAGDQWTAPQYLVQEWGTWDT